MIYQTSTDSAPFEFRKNQRLKIEQLVQLGQAGQKLSLETQLWKYIEDCHLFLLEQLASGRWIYGVSSGFGPLAGEDVPPGRSLEHQKHLLYHLATGTGRRLNLLQSRSLFALRLQQMSRGHSGISAGTFEQLIALFNAQMVPDIPSMGSVGASGDLTPLAHMALSFSGENPVWQEGKKVNAKKWLADNHLTAVQWKEKEALAFVNGTSCMTALAANNHVLAEQALKLSLLFSFLYGECMGTYAEAWHPLLARVKPHPGQLYITEKLSEWAAQSDWLIAAGRHEGKENFKDKWPQDPYSLRCIPQLLGAVKDQVEHHRRVVETEINSANDNPTFFVEEEWVLHGGNFNGQHISFVSDSLTQAMIYLAVYSERRIARICDPKMNHGLPPFLAASPVGINSGFMGAQVSSSSLVAQLRSMATPLAIQSISTNGNNQDIVSMGTLAAWRCHECLELLMQVLAIEAMVLARAACLRKAQFPSRSFSQVSREWLEKMNKKSEPLQKDRPLGTEIEGMAKWLGTCQLPF